MLKKLNIILLLILMIFILGCEFRSYYDTGKRTENAIVIEKRHLDKTEEIEWLYLPTSKGGFTMIPYVTGHPEKYILKFKCEKHNKIFDLEVPVDVYVMFSLNETVILEYYESRYKTSDDGKVSDHFDKAHTTKILKK